MQKKRARLLALAALEVLLMAWLLTAALLHQLTISTVGRGNLMLVSETLLGLDSIIAVVVLVESRLPEHLQGSALRWVNGLGMIVRVLLMGGGRFLLEIAPWLVAVAGVLILVSALQALKIEEPKKAARASTFVITILAALGFIVITNLDNMAAIVALSRGNWLLIALGIIFNLVFPYVGSEWVKNVMDRYQWARYLAAIVLAVLASYIVASWLEGAVAVWISLFASAQVVVVGAIFWLHRNDVMFWLRRRR